MEISALKVPAKTKKAGSASCGETHVCMPRSIDGRVGGVEGDSAEKSPLLLS